MTIKYVVIIGIMTAALIMPNIAFGSSSSGSRDLTEYENESEFYWIDGSVKSKINRPAINPDFAPDETTIVLLLGTIVTTTGLSSENRVLAYESSQAGSLANA